MRILVIEDDAKTATMICKGLRQAGHAVDHVYDGVDGMRSAKSASYDVLVVDRMLPTLSGGDIVSQLRSSNNQTPALFLSALGEVQDRIEGLQLGADDYLVKPFDMEELLARVEALGKRAPYAESETVLRLGGLEMDLLNRTVRRDGRKIDLQPKEFKLLEYLMRHQGKMVTRTMLLENVWEYHFDPQTNVIDVHISRLRSKIDKGFSEQLLETVRGSGYRLGKEKKE